MSQNGFIFPKDRSENTPKKLKAPNSNIGGWKMDHVHENSYLLQKMSGISSAMFVYRRFFFNFQQLQKKGEKITRWPIGRWM